MSKKSNFSRREAPRGFGAAPRGDFSGLASLFAEALALHQAGRLADAEQRYRRILATRPDHFDSLHLLGVIFHQQGRHADAVRQIDHALKRNSRNIFALNNRGTAQSELGRFADALASFDRALALKPDYAEAHSNRGNALKELSRFAEALASYDRALALKPDFAAAHANCGGVLNALGRFSEALESCDRALSLRPDHAEAHCNRGNALKELKRAGEALAAHDRAVALRPDHVAAHCNRGNALYDLNRFEDALASFERALTLKPGFAEAHTNRGNALHELNRLEDALVSHDRAVALKPGFAEAYANRGNTLKELERYADALTSFERAIALRPGFAEAHFHEALCRLLIGDFARGWREYEWRWETAQLKGQKRLLPEPQWTGAENITGKTIFLHAEQGFGDTLQFCRYVTLVAERGARVVIEVEKPLSALMATLPGVVQIVVRGEPPPPFDTHAPLLSLPLAFGTTLETVPAHMPYLSAPADRAAAWRDRLGVRERLRIGLVWAGNPRKEVPDAHRVDRQRSLVFGQLAPLLEVAGCEFYSLQKGEQAVEQLRASALRDRVIDRTDELQDFADTAALIENLDIVISVDTSVAHLAGALGKPFWLINRHNTCWRWLTGREDSPWYPTARLFRQDATRDWDGVIAGIAAALRAHVAAGSLQRVCV